MLMLNSILHACIQQAVHAGSLYVKTMISVAYVHKYIAATWIFKSIRMELRGPTKVPIQEHIRPDSP